MQACTSSFTGKAARRRRQREPPYLERNRCSNSGPARSASWRLFLSFFSRFLAETSTWKSCGPTDQASQHVRDSKTSERAKTSTRNGLHIKTTHRAQLAVRVRISKDHVCSPEVQDHVCSAEVQVLQDSAVHHRLHRTRAGTPLSSKAKQQKDRQKAICGPTWKLEVATPDADTIRVCQA